MYRYYVLTIRIIVFLYPIKSLTCFGLGKAWMMIINIISLCAYMLARNSLRLNMYSVVFLRCAHHAHSYP